jgi:murein DD-endopeptidase MepM/ murein hydrolase activator NlpD
VLWLGVSGGVGLAQSEATFPRVSPNEPFCPPSALSRVRSHTVAPGETIADIAAEYDLLPATLLGMNPSLRQGRPRPGSTLRIPPYNGIEIRIDRGTTWQDLAQRYDVRADVLFEANGCQVPAGRAFIPGANWSPLVETPDAAPESPTTDSLARYPLPNVVDAIVGYGWVLTPRSTQVVFHSGVDLPATVGTPVQAAEAGTVAFVGVREPYGNLVVINHSRGRQTRYAHLDRLDVRRGQTVEAGAQIGTVGTTGNPDAPQPHLHFEVRNNSDLGWVAENPAVYLGRYFRRPEA